MAAMIILMMFPMGLIAMSLTYKDRTRVGGWLGVGLYVTALAMFVVAVFQQQMHSISSRYVESGATILGFGLVAVPIACRPFDNQRRYWQWLGLASVGFVAGLVFLNIWTRSQIGANWVVSLSSVPVVIAHASLVMMVPLTDRQVWWRRVAIVATVATAIAWNLEFWSNNDSISWIGRLAVAAAIVASTASVALLILSRLRHSRVAAKPSSSTAEFTQMTVLCPKCKRQLTVNLIQKTRCDCGMKLKIHVEVL